MDECVKCSDDPGLSNIKPRNGVCGRCQRQEQRESEAYAQGEIDGKAGLTVLEKDVREKNARIEELEDALKHAGPPTRMAYECCVCGGYVALCRGCPPEKKHPCTCGPDDICLQCGPEKLEKLL